MSELIDIINEHDQVIGQADKDEAHQKGLLHRTVISELIDQTGNWILVKQATDRQDPGQFVSPIGGHVRTSESELDALVREAEEEVGLNEIHQNDITLIGKAIFNREVRNRTENHLFIVYKIKVDSKWQPILNHESVSYQKFTLAQIKNLVDTNSAQIGDAFKFVCDKFYYKLFQ